VGRRVVLRAIHPQAGGHAGLGYVQALVDLAQALQRDLGAGIGQNRKIRHFAYLLRSAVLKAFWPGRVMRPSAPLQPACRGIHKVKHWNTWSIPLNDAKNAGLISLKFATNLSAARCRWGPVRGSPAARQGPGGAAEDKKRRGPCGPLQSRFG